MPIKNELTLLDAYAVRNSDHNRCYNNHNNECE